MSTENKVFKMSLDVSDLISNYKKAIQTMQNIGGPNKAITSFEQQLNKLEAEFNNLQKKGKEGIGKDPSSVNNYTKAIDKAYNKLASLRDEMTKLSKNTDAFNVNGVKNLKNEINTLEKATQNFRKNFQQSLQGIGIDKQTAQQMAQQVRNENDLLRGLEEERQIRNQNLALAREELRVAREREIHRQESNAANSINVKSTSAASLSSYADTYLRQIIAQRQAEAQAHGQTYQYQDIQAFLQQVNKIFSDGLREVPHVNNVIEHFNQKWNEALQMIQDFTATPVYRQVANGARVISGYNVIDPQRIFGNEADAYAKALRPYLAVENFSITSREAGNVRGANENLRQIQQQINQVRNGYSQLNSDLNQLNNSEEKLLVTESQMASVRRKDEKILNEMTADVEKANAVLDQNRKKTDEQKNSMISVANSVHRAESTFVKFARTIGSMFSIYTVFAKVRQEIRKTYEDIKTLDKSFASIAMVTDKSVSDMWGTYEQYAAMASDLGQKTNSVIEASALYYQQGLDTNEALELTTHTMKLATLANENYKTATEEMTAAIRGFRMEMDSGSHVTDVYSTLAANAAASVNDIASAISRTASIANSAGSSFENTSAFLTKVIETTQESAENIGTSLKTIIARFTEMKQNISGSDESEFEDLDVNKVETALKSVGVQLRDATGQIRDFDDIIVDLGEKWDELSRNAQRYVATIAAGSRQQSRFIALLDDFDRTKELMDIAADSTGKADEQFAKYADTMEYKLNQLSTEWEKFKTGIIEENLFKNAIDNLTNFIERLNNIKLENVFDLAGFGTSIATTIIGAVTSVKTMKNLWANFGPNNAQISNNLWTAAFKSLENKHNLYQARTPQKVKLQSLWDTTILKQDLEQVSRVYRTYGQQAAQYYSETFSETLQRYNKLNPIQKMMGMTNGLSRTDFFKNFGGASTAEQNFNLVKEMTEVLRLRGGLPATEANMDMAFVEVQKKYVDVIRQVQREETQYNSLLQQSAIQKERVKQATDLLTNAENHNTQAIQANENEEKRYEEITRRLIALKEQENITYNKNVAALNRLKTGTSLITGVLSSFVMYLPMAINGTMSLGDAAKMAGSQALIMGASWAINAAQMKVLAATEAIKNKIDQESIAITWNLITAEITHQNVILGTIATLAPYLLIGAAVAGTVWLLIKAFDAEGNSAKKLREEQEKLKETQKKLNEAQADYKSSKQELKDAKELKERYLELKDIKNKTAEEQEEQNKLIEKIQETLPEIVVSYNEVTNELITQNDLWDSILEKQERSARKDAEKGIFSAVQNTNQELKVLEAQEERDLKYNEMSPEQLKKRVNKFLKTSNDLSYENFVNQMGDIVDQFNKLSIDIENSSNFSAFLQGNGALWTQYETAYLKEYDKQRKEIIDAGTNVISNFTSGITEIDSASAALAAKITSNDNFNYEKWARFSEEELLLKDQGRVLLKDYKYLTEGGYNYSPNKYLSELIKNIGEENWKNYRKGIYTSNSATIVDELIKTDAILHYTEVLSDLNDYQNKIIEQISTGEINTGKKEIDQIIDNAFKDKDQDFRDTLHDQVSEIFDSIDYSIIKKYNALNATDFIGTASPKQIKGLSEALSKFEKSAPSSATSEDFNAFESFVQRSFGGGASNLEAIFNAIDLSKFNPLDEDSFTNSIKKSLEQSLNGTDAYQYIDTFIAELSTKIKNNSFKNLIIGDADVAQIQAYAEKAIEVTKVFSDHAKDISKLLNAGKDTIAITADEYKSLNKFEEDLISAGVEGAEDILRMSEDETEFLFDAAKANEIKAKYGKDALAALEKELESDKEKLNNQKIELRQLQAKTYLNEKDAQRLVQLEEEVSIKEEEVKVGEKFTKELREQDELSKRIADNFNTASGRLAAMASLSNSVSSALSNFQKNKILKQSDISSLQEAFRPFGIDANSFINKNLGLSNPESLYKSAISELQKSLKSGLIKDPDEIMQAKAVIAELYGSWIDYLQETQEEADKLAETEKKNTEDREKLLEKIKEAEKKLREQEEDNAKDREKDLENIKKAEEDIEKARKDYQDQLETIEEKQKAINDAIEKYNELLYGSANRKGKLDLFYNYEQALSSLTDAMSRAEEKLGIAQDIDSATEALNNYAIAAKNLIATEKAKQVSIQAGLANYANMIENGTASYTNRETGQQIGIRFGDYAKKDKATGKYILNQRLLNQAKFNDEYKNLIEENIETYNKYLDEYNKINDEIAKKEKEFQEKRKQALKAYSDFEKSIADALKAQYEDEVEDLKDKYDSMKAADDDYLDALEDAINKQRQLREKEEKYESLAEQEKKLSLLSRDTSGSRTLDVNKLRKDVDKTRKQLLDEAVDEIVDGLKKLAKENEETRQVEMELRDAIVENTNHWNWQAEAIAPTFTNADDYANYMAGMNSDFEEMSWTQQQVQLQEYKDQFAEAVEYSAWNMLDAASGSGDAIVDIVDVSTESVMAIVSEKTTAFSDEVIRSYDEISQKVQDDLKNQEEAIDSARDALQDAIEKLDELQEKINEAIEKLAEMQKTFEENEIKRAEKQADAQKAIDDAWKELREKDAELLKAQQKKITEEKKTDLSNVIPGENNSPELNPSSVIPEVSPEQKATIPTGGDNGQTATPWSIAAATWKNEHGMNLAKFIRSALNAYSDNIPADMLSRQAVIGYVNGLGLESLKALYSKMSAHPNIAIDNIITNGTPTESDYRNPILKTISKYKQGGLVNYTGPAWVDGTPARPEAFLSAADTKAIGDAVRILSDLSIIRDYDNLGSITNNTVGDTSIEVNLNIENLSSDVDIDNMLERVKEEIVSVANPIGINTILKQS